MRPEDQPATPSTPTSPQGSSSPTAPATSEATNNAAAPEPPQATTPTDTVSAIEPSKAAPAPTPATKPAMPKIFKQWTFWAMSAFAVGCIFAVVFAVFAFSRSAVLEADVDRLKAEVADKDQQISRYAAQLGQQIGSSSRPGYIDESKVNLKDYIYVSGWGIRFKIPEGFKDVSYLLKVNLPERPEAEQTETLCVRGLPTTAPITPKYMERDLDESTLGCLTRSKESSHEAAFQNGDYYFYYNHANNVNSDKDEERLIITRAVSLARDLLTKNITNF